MQQCNFDFEVLIHDDASTDGTTEVISEYQQKNPDIIKPFFQIENQWSKGMRGMNQKFNYPRAVGKYIALCEGDDYWTDPLKLQKQVDFLENNEIYSAVITDRIIKNTESAREMVSNYPLITTTHEILRGEVMPTQCLMFRNIINYKDLHLFRNHLAGDRALSYILSLKGPIYCIKEIMAVYNYTGEGVWSKKKNENQTLLNARSLKEFYDLVGLQRGNGYAYKLVAMLISERSKGKLALTDEEVLRDFKIFRVQLITIKCRVFLSQIKNRIWT